MNRIKDIVSGPAGVVYKKLSNIKKERYREEEKISMISIILSIIIGVGAIYLSWTCNSLKGENTVLKIIYAFFAFLFAPIYIVLYILMVRPCVCISQVQSTQPTI
jgi:hypothetical protein